MPGTTVLAQLADLISDHFSEQELRDLCLELGVNYEHLSGDNTRAKSRELVQWAQRHGTLPALLEQVKTHRPHLAEQIGHLAVNLPQPPTPPRLHHIPYHRNPLFTGREEWLAALHAQLGQRGTVAVTQAVAGLGGMGKTQLALEYCYRHVAEYDLIYWLRADEAATLAGEMAELAYRLGAAPRHVTDQTALRAAALDWLHGTARRWLLVFDNVDLLEPADLQPYLPRLGNGGSLITSRNPRWEGLARTVRLKELPPEEAVAFLRQAKPDAPEAEAAHLAHLLGYLPLALEHARAFVAATGCTLAEYAHYLETARRELWAGVDAPVAYDRRTITTTWEVAFARARQVQGAAALLNLCCFLDPEAIPLALLRRAAETPGFLEKPGPLALEAALRELGRYSLVQREGEGVRLHRLVQMVARDQMPPETAQNTVAAAVELLAAAWPYDQQDMNTWPASADLLPHLLAAAAAGERAESIPHRTGYLWNQAGFYLHHRAVYTQAGDCYRRALAIDEKALGPDHPTVATRLNNLGMLLKDEGDLAGARPYLERALAIDEKALGPDHPEVAIRLNNLGMLLQAEGDLTGARPYLERALAIDEKALGPDHPEVAIRLNNLGMLLQAEGDLTGARPYLERALAIWEKALGSDHPQVAIGSSNLGTLMQDEGDLAGARPYLERALAIDERAYGPDHPEVATDLNNLGILMQDEGDLAGARVHLERALAICEARLGPEHPHTRTTRHNLANL
ncbi:MAG: tetratricopeptide repeat protein [Anaerolineae bacterium]|nr:tetratricopeptide repeat protein [Anaerolineae bacterium]